MKLLGTYPATRLRRLRKAKWLRDLVSETKISPCDLIQPIFVREGKNKIENIKTMPGVKRYSVDKLPIILNQVKKYKIPMVSIFPYTENKKKNNKRFSTMVHIELIAYTTYCIVFSTACYLVLKK